MPRFEAHILQITNPHCDMLTIVSNEISFLLVCLLFGMGYSNYNDCNNRAFFLISGSHWKFLLNSLASFN